MDAIFISPHKFIGGPNTPGVIVAKKRLLKNAPVAAEPGGGTVFFVRDYFGWFAVFSLMISLAGS